MYSWEYEQWACSKISDWWSCGCSEKYGAVKNIRYGWLSCALLTKVLAHCGRDISVLFTCTK